MGNFKAAFTSRPMQWNAVTEEKQKNELAACKRCKKKIGKERGGGKSLPISLVDASSVSNHMAKHRSAVSVSCRVQYVASACNAGGSSSLHTRMNAAARLMQPLRCAATHFKTSNRFLQHASNTQRTQALARQAQRTAQHARCYSCTCTFFTRPLITRSKINLIQRLVVL
jgi:hypothetical protein